MHVVSKFLQVLSLPNLIFAFFIENTSGAVPVCKVTGRSHRLPLVHVVQVVQAVQALIGTAATSSF
jgi:hypothetical protein